MKNFIGIFDSGMGGLTVLGDLMKALPHENFVYFGDSVNAPYGVKSKEEVQKLSMKICDDFILQGAKAIVVACNTATSAAINILRKKYNIPIIGMEPALKPATKNESVAVMATEMTLKEDKFNEQYNKFKDLSTILKVPAPKLVEFVEKGELNTVNVDNYIKSLFVGNENIKSIVLGCTHYLFLRDTIQRLFSDVKLYDGNAGTVNRTIYLLKENQLLNNVGKQSIVIKNSASENMVERSWELLNIYLEMNKSE
jgi:glutamate racemase